MPQLELRIPGDKKLLVTGKAGRIPDLLRQRNAGYQLEGGTVYRLGFNQAGEHLLADEGEVESPVFHLTVAFL